MRSIMVGYLPTPFLRRSLEKVTGKVTEDISEKDSHTGPERFGCFGPRACRSCVTGAFTSSGRPETCRIVRPGNAPVCCARSAQDRTQGCPGSPFRPRSPGYGVRVTLIPLTGLPCAPVNRTEPCQLKSSFTTLNTSTLSPAFRVMSDTTS